MIHTMQHHKTKPQVVSYKSMEFPLSNGRSFMAKCPTDLKKQDIESLKMYLDIMIASFVEDEAPNEKSLSQV